MIGDPSVGFEHEFKRDYGGDDSRRVSKTLRLGKVVSEHIRNRKDKGRNVDNIPNNTLEDIAFSIPPPSKSLRHSSNSVSFEQSISWLPVSAKSKVCCRWAEKSK